MREIEELLERLKELECKVFPKRDELLKLIEKFECQDTQITNNMENNPGSSSIETLESHVKLCQQFENLDIWIDDMAYRHGIKPYEIWEWLEREILKINI